MRKKCIFAVEKLTAMQPRKEYIKSSFTASSRGCKNGLCWCFSSFSLQNNECLNDVRYSVSLGVIDQFVGGFTSSGKYEEPQWGYEPRLAETLSLQIQPRDEETGCSYFGARYYDAEILTGWLSVDPMADKYPHISPYNYCTLNPMRLEDPDGREVVNDWVKDKKTGLYEWNDNATSPNNTPEGYSYVGNDDALLRDLNVRTSYETQEDCKTGYSPNMGSNYASFTRLRNCNDAAIRVGVSVKNDKQNISSDNPNGKSFDGINIYGFVNQWSKTASGETNTIVYYGILEISGTNGFRSQSGFTRPSGECLYASGAIPMQATIHIPANVMYNNIITCVNIKLGFASASLFNSPKSFSWSLLLNSVIR